MQLKIEMRYLYGWDDAGWTEEKDDIETPLRFQSPDQAQVALDEFMAHVKHAVIMGNMDIEAVRDDYRIVTVSDSMNYQSPLPLVVLVHGESTPSEMDS